MEGDYNIVMVSAIYQHVQYFFLLFFSPQVSGEPTPIAIVSAKGPEDQEDVSTSSLTCSLTLSLSSWPWFCLLGINFRLAPLALPYPCHRTLSRGWGCVASDRPRRQMAHSSQAGLFTEGVNGTVEEDDSVCCVFPKGYLAKELRANSSDSGIQTRVWPEDRPGARWAFGRNDTPCFARLLREIVLQKLPLRLLLCEDFVTEKTSTVQVSPDLMSCIQNLVWKQSILNPKAVHIKAQSALHILGFHIEGFNQP